MAGPSNHPAAAYPTWLPHPACPVRVIVGPPGNGGRLHALSRAAADEVVIDVPSIIAEISGGHGDPAVWVVRAMERRNQMLADLAKPDGPPGAWLISPSPRQWQRDFWSRTLGAEIILLDPGKQRAIEGATAEGVPVKFVHQYYFEAQDTLAGMMMPPARVSTPRPATAPADRPSSHKRGYGTSHRTNRDKQLLREPWCRFCWEERGVKVPATVLDHVIPFRKPDGEMDWKLWGDPSNWRSLCGPCHDARGAQRNRPEKPPGAGGDGRPLDPSHPWNQRR